jgi:hypothetical protein
VTRVGHTWLIRSMMVCADGRRDTLWQKQGLKKEGDSIAAEQYCDVVVVVVVVVVVLLFLFLFFEMMIALLL